MHRSAHVAELARRRILYAGLAAAPLLTSIAVAADPHSTRAGRAVFVGVWTAVAWSTVAIAAVDLRRASTDGSVAFSLGLAMAALALGMTWAGGLAIVPALCLIALAASVRRDGGWYRGRLIVAVGSFLAAAVVYGVALVSYGELPNWL